MKTISWSRTVVTVLIGMTVVFSGVQNGLAAPTVRGYGTNVAYDPNTGALAFIGTNPGEPVPSFLSNPSAASATSNAAAFISSFAPQMGLSSISGELALAATGRSANGGSLVRYHQVYQGITVFASDVIINTNSQGAMTSLTSKTSPKLSTDTNPAITAEAAAVTAVKSTARSENLAAEALTAGAPELQIYDSRLLVSDGKPARLVWKIVVTANSAPVREVVLVDAHTGAVSLHYNQIDTAFSTPGRKPTGNRAPGAGVGRQPAGSAHMPGSAAFSVYDMSNKCDPGDFICLYFYGGGGVRSLPGNFLCDQNDTAPCDSAGDTDAVDAYAFGQDTYSFYFNRFGRDSYDGGGAELVSVINYGLNFPNAGWDGVEMVYGDGFATADDVVGHELTHAVTENSSELIYYAQPGAINESFSDVFGEFIDQTNGHGTDTPAKKWLMGEDLPASIGVVRNMANPPAYHDPDRIGSTYYYIGYADNAGVHTNSGVNNKAAYLLTDGGAFNGKAIVGLGIPKVAAIYYEVQTHLLGSGASYFDLYYALNQACTNLLGSTPVGASSPISATDCQQVQKTVDAVQMNLTKSAAFYPVAPYCPVVGQEPKKPEIFFDDFESGAAQWTFSHDPSLPGASSLTADWMIATGDSAGKSNALLGGYVGNVNDSSATMASPVAIPSVGNFFLHFEHDDSFDDSWNYDGGVVEYSKDGGPWVDAAPLFSAGRNYNGTILSQFGNPLGGRRAFVYYTMNYTGTRYNLNSLRGHNVQFRFRIGNDNLFESSWFVDNVRIYECLGIPGVPLLVAPVSNKLLSAALPLVIDWRDAVPSLDHYQLQVDDDPLFGSPEIDDSSLTTSTYTIPSGLNDATNYYWRVQAFNSNGTSKGWSVTRVFRTLIAAPTSLSPSGPIGSPLPVFDWDDMTGATGYTFQVSLSPTFSSLLVNKVIVGAISTYAPLSNLPAGKTLYWRVRATGPNGPSAWAPTVTISTP